MTQRFSTDSWATVPPVIPFQPASDRAASRHRLRRFISALVFILVGSLMNLAYAASATVGYQPMVSAGLAAGQPFEAWIVLDKPLDPSAPGYALPGGASIRFTFAEPFTPLAGVNAEAVLLYGWPQKAIPAKFTVGVDPKDPRTIIITLLEAVPAAPPDKPGLKAIHLRTGEINPRTAGNYPIDIQFVAAGELTGATRTMASITDAPVPVVAAYNQLHDGRNEDWQHVKRGEAALLPIDLLVTLPDKARSSIALWPAANGSLEIVSDDAPIGTVTAHGATLKPESFGPGFARLGIVRFRATAGTTPGVAEINAQLKGGPVYTLHLVVEP